MRSASGNGSATSPAAANCSAQFSFHTEDDGFGATLLTCVSIGAFLTQLLILHVDVIHTLVFTAATGSIAWIKRKQILSDLGIGLSERGSAQDQQAE
jgi:hypothetical protein